MSAPNTSRLGHLLYEPETDWAEDSSSFSTRLPIFEEPDFSPEQGRLPVGRMVQLMNDEALSVRGPQGGSIGLRLPGTGHGSTCAGSISATALATLLGYVFGGRTSSYEGTTVDGVGATASSFDVASASGLERGAIIRVGVKGDGRGEGQAAAIASISGTTVNLLNALPGAPNNGDVVYVMEMVYPIEDPSSNAADLDSLRFQFATADQRYNLHGCFPQSVGLELGDGTYPMWSAGFGISRWQPTSGGAFPSTASVQKFAPHVMGGGSFFKNEVGESTRQTLSVRSVEVSWDFQVQSLPGFDGEGLHQNIVGARRLLSAATLTYTLDSEAAGTDTLGDEWNTEEHDYVNRHHLITLNPVDGKSVALYFPNCQPVESRPVQFTEDNLNRKRISYRCIPSSDDTTDLTQSSFRIGLG